MKNTGGALKERLLSIIGAMGEHPEQTVALELFPGGQGVGKTVEQVLKRLRQQLFPLLNKCGRRWSADPVLKIAQNDFTSSRMQCH